jgi:hypothetical protein
LGRQRGINVGLKIVIDLDPLLKSLFFFPAFTLVEKSEMGLKGDE